MLYTTAGQLLKPVGDEWLYTEVSWPGAGKPFFILASCGSHTLETDLAIIKIL